MLDNLQLLHITDDQVQCVQSEFSAVKAKEKASSVHIAFCCVFYVHQKSSLVGINLNGSNTVISLIGWDKKRVSGVPFFLPQIVNLDLEIKSTNRYVC